MFAGNWLLLSVIADQKIGQAHMVYVRHDPDGKCEACKEYVLPDGRRCTVRMVLPGDTYVGELLSRIYAMKIDGKGDMWHDLQYLLFAVRELGVEDGKAQAERERAEKAAREERAMKALGDSIIALKREVDALERNIHESEVAYKAKLKQRDREIRRLRRRPLPRREKGVVIKDATLEGKPAVSHGVLRELDKAATQIYEGKRKKK